MVKTSGIILIALVLAVPLLVVDLLTKSNFLQYFTRELSLNILLTLLALSVATVTFLLGQVVLLEAKYNKRFKNFRRELRQNIYFMTILCGLDFLVASASGKHTFHFAGMNGQDLLGYISAVLTIMLVFALIEIVDLVFSLDGTTNNSDR